MKKIGFLSFGHYQDDPGATLREHVEFARIADEVGFDGAWVRVHHFDSTMSAPFPLLSAMAAVTRRLEVGTGVVDLRYENPLYLAEEAGATDLLSQGRLQLGISRGSPEPAVDGQRKFGYLLADGESWADHAQSKAARFMSAIRGEPVARSARAEQFGSGPDLPIRPTSPGLPDRIWWGAGSRPSGVWAGEAGYNLLSSTLLLEDDGRPFHVQQADQVRAYRRVYAKSGHTGPGHAAVTRPAFPITSDEDRRYFWHRGDGKDSVGYLDGGKARSGPQLIGSIDEVATLLSEDEAVTEADYVLFAMPSTLGVEYNAHWMGNVVDVARQLGWK